MPAGGINTMTLPISGYGIDKALPAGVIVDDTTIGTLEPQPGNFTTITSTGGYAPSGDITLANGKAIKTDTTTAHTAVLQAYDVNGTAYKTFATLTNGDTPSFNITAPSGGTVAINGAVIGGTTPAAATVTALTQTGAGANIFNSSSLDTDFTVKKLTSGNAIAFDAGTVALALDSTTIGLTGITTQTGNFTQTGAGAVIFNNSAVDTDFTVKALTAGNAISYDAGTSAIALEATTIGATGAVTITGAVSQSGSTTYTAATSGITLKQGANGRVGTFTLNGVTPVSVSNSSITANSVPVFALRTVGGTVSVSAPNIVTITVGVGFDVVGLALDTSVYNYVIIESAA